MLHGVVCEAGIPMVTEGVTGDNCTRGDAEREFSAILVSDAYDGVTGMLGR